MKTTLSALAIALCAISSFAQVRVIDTPYQPPTAVAAVSVAAAVANPAPVHSPYMAQPTTPLQVGFEVTPADLNLRRTLARWSKLVGWSFEPEHWTLHNDIPISGSASLGNDFKGAVRTLLASSEMTDLPAQPCFYSNNVLRVIPLTELCSRQQAPKAQ
jgi:Toxin co-regulated pilus biosynthesis protein Q